MKSFTKPLSPTERAAFREHSPFLPLPAMGTVEQRLSALLVRFGSPRVIRLSKQERLEFEACRAA